MKTLLIACTLALSSFGAGTPAIAAEPVRETRVASGFSRIDIDGQADVILRQGTSEGVTIEASAQALRNIDTGVHGKALVNASKSLKVEISGAGAVQYIGNPKIDQEISGVGKITRRDGP